MTEHADPTLSPELLDNYDEKRIHDALSRELQTVSALFFHAAHNALVLTTAHAVHTGADGVPLVGPGRPLTPEDEEGILRLLLSRDGASVFDVLPASVLYTDRLTLMWWLPGEVRPMHLLSHDRGHHTILTRWPSLVAMVRNRTLYLAAVEGDARPTADTPLFHAPLPNTYASTAVCTGSARLPLGQRAGDLDGWNAVIFDSAFTHTNHTATLAPERVTTRAKSGKPRSRKQPRHANAEWWSAHDGRTEAFPFDALNPLGLTLAQWLPSVLATARGGRRDADEVPH